jgi:Fe2+ or Zn2+ uptake regulation protein
MEKTRVDFKAILRRVGFRATEPRLELLSFLSKQHLPLSIIEIASGLKPKRIDQVTVYRMVEAFAKAGIASEVNLKGERPRYELSDTEHDHHHIVCTSCHKVEDFIGCNTTQLEKKALHQSHFSKVTGHSFDLYGLCNSCAR